MFGQLSDKLQNAFKNLSRAGIIKESHIESALRDVRMALLESDVNLNVVRDFLNRIKERALGENIVGSNSPEQQFYKIVYDELVTTLGGKEQNLTFTGNPPHIILMVGLQGSGKTTSSAKLAQWWHKKGRHPYLVPADFARPAAVEQLKTLAKQIQMPFYESDIAKDVVKTVRDAVDKASDLGRDLVIVDTAGRLHVDETLMDELKRIKEKPTESSLLFGRKALPVTVLFVADAMTGQEAITVAKKFHDELQINGVILTKMDGDAKGGAALSIQAVAGCPIYYVGMGEKISDFDLFYPDRLVSRLLDRGDMMSLIEKAQEAIDPEFAEGMVDKFKKGGFDLEDFRQQLKQMKKLGSMSSIMSFLPGAKQISKNVDMDKMEVELKRKEAIINSMTLQERRRPDVLNGQRRNRIALGSGTTVAEINRFMKEFNEMKKMMDGFSKGGLGSLTKIKSMLGM